jgi:UDP-N-acetylmuramyl tripeptide synthase
VKQAEEGDVIVITGMGSFQTRSMNDGPMPWDEREVAREIIQKYS